MDPRVTISESALQMQTDLSKVCYDGYHELQDIVEAIDGLTNPTELQRNFRGEGSVGNPDTMYGSIYQTDPSQETLVGLQEKFLFMIDLIQAADVQPTTQTIEAVDTLNQTLGELKERWETIK
jgi:hypothetical protein